MLVGHSYGGTLITKAGTHDRVGALVYIAALTPDEGETSQEQLDKFPRTPIVEHVDVADGRVWLKPSGVPHFCGDLPEAEQELVLATGAVPVADLFNQQAPGTAWRTKSSWFIVANNDRTVPPDLERSAAERPSTPRASRQRPAPAQHAGWRPRTYRAASSQRHRAFKLSNTPTDGPGAPRFHCAIE